MAWLDGSRSAHCKVNPEMNLKLLLAYDGTDFNGWQVQPDRRTVQGVLEEAIRDLTGEQPRLLCAGRTDAGVHALGQVASLETRSRIPPEKWRPALQVRLPRDLVIREVVEVGERAELGIDIAVVADVVPEVPHRTAEERRDPDGIHPEVGEVVEVPSDASEVADAVAVISTVDPIMGEVDR
mgnify:CR=1 FL=1